MNRSRAAIGPEYRPSVPLPFGVCHNSSNYPNFETAGNTIAYVGAPCNVEIPDPSQGWDSCERLSDMIKLGTFTSKFAFINSKSLGAPGSSCGATERIWVRDFDRCTRFFRLRRVEAITSDGSICN